MQTSSSSGHTEDLDSAISKVREKLDKERTMLEKTRQLNTQLSNANAKANAQDMILKAEQRIAYLEAEFGRLSQKRTNSIKSGAGGSSLNEDVQSLSDNASTGSGRTHSSSLSKLDLRKASSSLSAQKISLKVHEIAYKLEVERKIRDKASSIRSLYSTSPSGGGGGGSRRGNKEKNPNVVESDRILREADDRIRLLDYSLKMYQSLYVDYADDSADSDTLNEEDQHPGGGGLYQNIAMRRPVTGKLQLRIHRAKNLRRAPLTSKIFRTPQQFVVVKVDGKICGTTPIVRDSVFNYYFEVDVKKASEVELSIFEKTDKDYLTGLMWVRLSEVFEECRKKEMMAEASGEWTTADQLANRNQSSGHPTIAASATGGIYPTNSRQGVNPSPSSGSNMSGATTRTPSITDKGIYSEWDVESQGQIELWVNFIKETPKRRQQSRLGRKAAVRKRREPCTEMCGHHFYPLHTYSIMKCAICSEHIVNEVGQQCDDCQLFVHQKCVGRVVSHCHFNQEEAEALELGHRIPHRWNMSTNIGASWCCHCGNMLPIGRKIMKCSECVLACHPGCKTYVPNMCGLDMAKASAMLSEIKRAKGAAVPKPKVVTKRDTVAKKHQQAPPLHSQISTGSGINAPSADAQVADIQNRLQQMQPPSSAANNNYQQQYNPYGGGRQRTGSNEFVPIKSATSSPAQRPQQLPNIYQQQQQQQQQYRPQTTVQPPSYYQQQMQMAKHHPFPNQQQQQQPQISQYQQMPRPMQYPPSPQQQMQQQYPPSPQQQMQQQQQQPYPYQQQQQYQQRPPPSPQQQQQQQQQQQYNQQRPQYGSPYPPPAVSQPSPGSAPADPSYAIKQQIHQAMSTPPSTQQQLHQQKAQQQQHAQPPRKVGINDFRFVKVLGKGNFGKVMLSEEKSTSKLYAIKVLKKEFIVENDEFESTRSEKRVLLIANKERHPFLIGLHSCFQTSNHIFFTMEYISGGDLMMHVQKLGSFGERKAKFFACEILLGLAYFHKTGIIYRDLKLDNIMLDNEGHVKIADYGLCKENMWYGQTTITFCGTPEFMAPEIVLEQRYGRAVDWWAFGVLIYEMILGTSPFHGEDENEIFDSILDDEILYPVRMSRDSVFICQALLEKDPAKRLGSGPADAEDIMKHSFFAGINWDDVLNKKIPPPYVPDIRGRFDVSNFDPEFTNEKPGLTPTNTLIEKRDQESFSDFDYVSPWAGVSEKWTR